MIFTIPRGSISITTAGVTTMTAVIGATFARTHGEVVKAGEATMAGEASMPVITGLSRVAKGSAASMDMDEAIFVALRTSTVTRASKAAIEDSMATRTSGAMAISVALAAFTVAPDIRTMGFTAAATMAGIMDTGEAGKSKS